VIDDILWEAAMSKRRKQANTREVGWVGKGGEVMLGRVDWDAQTVVGLSGKRGMET